MKLGNLKPIPKKSETAVEVRKALGENAAGDRLVESKQSPETREPDNGDDSEERIANRDRKLSRLVEGDFPFDESQLDAIDGIAREQYACLTGAAGTGKTTTTQAIVDRLVDAAEVSEVNMKEYFKRGDPGDLDDPDDRDESEKPAWVPSIAMCAFTGRASQMIKRNFPRDWHSNIMTIHRMLAYVPERYEDFDEESGEYKWKMRFIPTYTADCLLPWDIIIIDEAGMLSTDLWMNLWAACKPGCRIIMIGDINQLPPVHGKSVFGFAMSKWPTWELKKVHRQKGVDNPIVDNAWRIIHGQRPESGGRFQMVPLKGDAQLSSRKVRAIMPELQKRGVYDPIRDSIITPINGEDGSRGFALGQLPLNREFALIFNPQTANPRFIIDGGRDRKQFAVGDKVMATKNDWQAGITNGMTGVITEISANEGYGGDWTRFGPVEEVNRRMRESELDDSDDVEFTLEELESDFEATDSKIRKAREKKERGPASHTVVVRFGTEEHGIEIPFASLSEVGSLMTAYVVTCHKMQGGEAPVVVIICHDSHKSMLYREWLYTAVTRAADKCILLYTETALRTALNKQSIKGRTLKEKVASFNAIVGNVSVYLPDSDSQRNLIMEREDETFMTPARLMTTAEKSGGLAQLIKKQRDVADGNTPPSPEEKTAPRMRVDVHVHKTVNIKVSAAPPPPPPPPPPIREVKDGGDVTPIKPTYSLEAQMKYITDSQRARNQPNKQRNLEETCQLLGIPAPPGLSKPCTYESTMGAVLMMHKLEDAMNQRLLPPPPPKPVNKLALKLGLKK